MRTIRFRGKLLDNGEWVYGYIVENLDRSICIQKIEERIIGIYAVPHICYPVDPATVGQFTGLTDKNGKQIYEGDIIECIDSKGNPIRHQILFNQQRGCLCQFSVVIEMYCNEYPDCGAIHQGYIISHKKYVIGNIHENKELLK